MIQLQPSCRPQHHLSQHPLLFHQDQAPCPLPTWHITPTPPGVSFLLMLQGSSCPGSCGAGVGSSDSAARLPWLSPWPACHRSCGDQASLCHCRVSPAKQDCPHMPHRMDRTCQHSPSLTAVQHSLLELPLLCLGMFILPATCSHSVPYLQSSLHYSSFSLTTSIAHLTHQQPEGAIYRERNIINAWPSSMDRLMSAAGIPIPALTLVPTFLDGPGTDLSSHHPLACDP